MNSRPHPTSRARGRAITAFGFGVALLALHAALAAQAEQAAVPGATRSGTVPAIRVVGNRFLDGNDATVVLRGVASMGMSMVYGDKDSLNNSVMSVNDYIDRATQTDATGGTWHSNAIRLAFERFPTANPQRLYTVEHVPYAMPDTIAFPPWRPSRLYSEGEMVTFGGSRWQAMKKLWRADRGVEWNPEPYQVGEVVVNDSGDVYRCVSRTGSGEPAGDWGQAPRGTGQAIPENQGALRYVWAYIGRFGLSAMVPPSRTRITDNGREYVVDNLVQWRYISNDYGGSQALKNFNDWKSKVMDPAIARAVRNKLYVVIADFDFGPAHHPLRRARLVEFWTRIAESQWANHPNVIFELWNESEDIGEYGGTANSWAAQKPIIQSTINAIRAVGANNIIIVPTPLYSTRVGEATANPLTGSNLAYAVHQYRSQWENSADNRDQITQALSSRHAIVFTEWGDDTNPPSADAAWPTMSRVGPSLRQLLEAGDGSLTPAAGWFAWSMSESWFPGLFTDPELKRPNVFGLATRQWLHDKRAGAAPAATAQGTTAVPPVPSTGTTPQGGSAPRPMP